MSESSVTISPSAMGAGSAVLGLGAGYVLAPQKYTLDRLLMQSPDTFERQFSRNVLKKATAGEIKSFENLSQAAKTYQESGGDIFKKEIRPNAQIWHDMVSKVNVEDKYVSEVARTKELYLKALENTKFMEAKKSLENAQELVLKNPKDIKAHLELKGASRNFADAQLAVEYPLKLYKNARAAFRSAREDAILELPDKGKSISKQWDKVRRAISNRADVMYEKLATLSKNKELNKDYSMIKKYIPKSRTYSAMMGGILSGILGVIVGIYSLNKTT